MIPPFLQSGPQRFTAIRCIFLIGRSRSGASEGTANGLYNIIESARIESQLRYSIWRIIGRATIDQKSQWKRFERVEVAWAQEMMKQNLGLLFYSRIPKIYLNVKNR